MTFYKSCLRITTILLVTHSHEVSLIITYKSNLLSYRILLFYKIKDIVVVVNKRCFLLKQGVPYKPLWISEKPTVLTPLSTMTVDDSSPVSKRICKCHESCRGVSFLIDRVLQLSHLRLLVNRYCYGFIMFIITLFSITKVLCLLLSIII